MLPSPPALRTRVPMGVAAGLACGLLGCESTPPGPAEFSGTHTFVVAIASEEGLAAVVADFSGFRGEFTSKNNLVFTASSSTERLLVPLVPDSACGRQGIAEFSCYQVDWGSTILAPGDSVRLEAFGANGEELQGLTVMPTPVKATVGGDSVASVVLSSSSFEVSSLVIDAASAGAHLVQVYPQRLIAHQSEGDVECPGSAGTAIGLTTATAGTQVFMSIQRPTCSNPTAAVDSFSVYLAVGSFDAAYAAYWNATEQRGVPIADASFGLDGVVGVFGSVMTGSPVRVSVVVGN